MGFNHDRRAASYITGGQRLMICIRTRRIFHRGSNPNSLQGGRGSGVGISPHLSRQASPHANNRSAILDHRAGRQVPALVQPLQACRPSGAPARQPARRNHPPP